MGRCDHERRYQTPLTDIDDEKLSRRDYRFIFPEFLPDPNIEFRNPIAEKLHRKDLIARRGQVEIPGTTRSHQNSDILLSIFLL